MGDKPWNSVKGVEAAEFFGVVPESVRGWVVKEGCPRNADGSYDLSAIFRWWRSVRTVDGAGEGLDLKREQARMYKARADHAELALAKAQGVLVEAERVARDVGNLMVTIRAKLTQIPPSLYQRLANREPGEVLAELEKSIDETLAELANYNPLVAEPGADKAVEEVLTAEIEDDDEPVAVALKRGRGRPRKGDGV